MIHKDLINFNAKLWTRERILEFEKNKLGIDIAKAG